MVLTCGEDDGIDGRVVVDRGDILLPFKQYVQEPIEFVIEAGRIREIAGDGYQAALVRQYIADFDDPDGYGLSHIGWGSTSGRNGQRSRPTVAATAWSSVRSPATCSSRPGPTISSAVRTISSCHLDIPMRNCSLWCDDRQVIADGEIVIDEMRPTDAPLRV